MPSRTFAPLRAAHGRRGPPHSYCRPAGATSKAPFASGLTVSRQVGNAVERNRVRRRLREIVRLAAGGDMRAGHDYVLIGRRAALALPFAQMRQELDAALGWIHSPDIIAERGGRAGNW